MKAKDRATGKEQQVRITASSMLVQGRRGQDGPRGREHADEDRKRREEVEIRNQAEQLTYQAERTLKDLGDKVSSEDKATVETQVAALREALKGTDMELIQAGMTHGHGDAQPRDRGRVPGGERRRGRGARG